MLDRTYAEIVTRKVPARDQTMHFFNQPVLNFYHRDLLSCSVSDSIQTAARQMRERRCSSIFVKNDTGEHIGIVTDNDFRTKVVAEGRSVTRPVGEIMSAPLVSLSLQEHVFEALITMMRTNIKHLAVRGSDDRVVGVVTNQDLLTAQGQSPIFLIRDIENANRFEQIEKIHEALPPIIQGFINSGAKSRNVNRLITTISDAILRKIIRFSIDEKGSPPVDFVFMIMGSEGRSEQTLKTDQDNAIIYQDVPNDDDQPAVHAYFLELGEMICSRLDRAGYDFCKGGIMAQNEKWCQPLSRWMDYFDTGFTSPKPRSC
jgi:CBS domain-containing protein